MQSITGGRGPYKSGLKTQKSIVDSAIGLLIDEGYHNFSLRKVAQRSGISGGNLQHHFKSKEELVASMLDSLMVVYLETFNEISKPELPPKERLQKIVAHVTLDLHKKSTTIIWPELWALSNHNKSVRIALDKIYGQYREVLKECVLKINPELSPEQTEKIAIFINATIEGHTMFIGYKRNWVHHTEATIEMAYKSFLFLIESGNIPK